MLTQTQCDKINNEVFPLAVQRINRKDPANYYQSPNNFNVLLEAFREKCIADGITTEAGIYNMMLNAEAWISIWEICDTAKVLERDPEVVKQEEEVDRKRRYEEKVRRLQEQDRRSGSLMELSRANRTPEQIAAEEKAYSDNLANKDDLQNEVPSVEEIQALIKEKTPRQIAALIAALPTTEHIKLFAQRQREAERNIREVEVPRKQKVVVLSPEAKTIAQRIGRGRMAYEPVRKWMDLVDNRIIRELFAFYPSLETRVNAILAKKDDPAPGEVYGRE